MVMELDTYPTLDNEFSPEGEPLRILEVELDKADDIFTVPDWLSPFIQEVTGESTYSNWNLARKPSP